MAGCDASNSVEFAPRPPAGARSLQSAWLEPGRDPSTSTSPTQFPTDRELTPDAPARDWQQIVLHHSATASGSVESIDRAHRQRTDNDGRPWLGIGYHFVIGNGSGMPDGSVQATFRWQRQLAGAHAGSRAANEHGIGICLIGNFNDQPPTSRQQQALVRLLEVLTRRYAIETAQIVRHADIRATECPGKQFPYDSLLADPVLRSQPSR